MQRFEGRTIVLTGVGREGQVGEVVARAFAAEGATLILVDRDAEQVSARADTLRAAGHTVHPESSDLTDPDQVAALARTIVDGHDGRTDGWISMAGGFARRGPVSASTY